MSAPRSASAAAAVPGLVVRRARVRLRSLDHAVLPPADRSLDELARVDLFWSIATGMALVDHVRGADFQARHYLAGMRCGDPVRAARALAAETPGEVSTRLSRRLKVPEGEHVTDIEAPWGIASCLMVSRGGQTPWRVGLRTPSFANLSALGPALVGARVTQLPDVVASLGYTVGDADK